MTEEFTAIKFHVIPWNVDTNVIGWSGSYATDITDRVLQDPAPRGFMGIRSNGFMDRLADAGEMTVYFDNSDGLLTSTDAWMARIEGAILMTCTWDGIEMVKWAGYYKPGSKKIGLFKTNSYIEVTYIDFIGWATKYELTNVEYQVNMTIDEAVRYLLEKLAEIDIHIMPFKLEMDTGYYTFVDLFDTQGQETTIGGEFRKLAESELGYIYLTHGPYKYRVKAQEYSNSILIDSLVVENRRHRNFNFGDGAYTQIPVKSSAHDGDHLLLVDGTSSLLLVDNSSYLLLIDTSTITITAEDLLIDGRNEMVRDAHHFNFIRVVTRPRTYDADNTTVLWTMESSQMIAAGETVSGIRGRFRDIEGGASYINCIDLHSVDQNTDYKAYENSDGTGTDLTGNLVVEAILHASEVELNLTNNGATDLYTGGDILFQVRGQGVKLYDSVEVTIDMRDVIYQNTDQVFPVSGVDVLDMDLYYKTDANDIIEAMGNKAYWSGLPRSNLEAITLSANRDTDNMRLWMYGGVGTAFRATISNTYISYDQAVFINGFSFEVINGKYIKWTIIPFEANRAIRTT